MLLENVKIITDKIRALPVVLYGREILSLTLKKEQIRVFENRVLGRILGPKRGLN
jgi:hypothetical protein